MNPWTPLIAATFGWAASVVLTRAAILRGVGAFTIVPLRMVFALLALGLVMVFSRRFWTTNPTAWRRGLILGTVGMAIPMTLMTLAFEDLPVSLGSLLIALIPLATIAAAHFLVDGERFHAGSLPGLLVALLGTGLLVGVGGDTVEGVDNLWRGVTLVFAGVISAGIGGALTRRFALELSGDELVLPQFTVNTAVVLLLVPAVFDLELASIDAASWWMIAGIGALGTTFAFAAFLIAANINSAARLGLTGYSVPVLSVAMAVIFLNEKLTAPVVLGAILIVAGVILAERYTPHVPEPGVVTSR